MSVPELGPFEPFVDPRKNPLFREMCFPLCDGLAAPPQPSSLHERRCLEFLAAYYRINLEQSLVLDSGALSGTEPAALLAAMDTLERLEDHYAPVGFFGEPVMDGVYYADIHFIRPEVPCPPPRPETAGFHFAVPGLEDLPLSELTGPVVTRRWIPSPERDEENHS